MARRVPGQRGLNCASWICQRLHQWSCGSCNSAIVVLSSKKHFDLNHVRLPINFSVCAMDKQQRWRNIGADWQWTYLIIKPVRKVSPSMTRLASAQKYLGSNNSACRTCKYLWMVGLVMAKPEWLANLWHFYFYHILITSVSPLLLPSGISAVKMSIYRRRLTQ